MKIYLKNIVNLLILIELCYLTNGSELIKAKERDEAPVRKISSYEELKVDPYEAWQTSNSNSLFYNAAQAVDYSDYCIPNGNKYLISSTRVEENPAWGINLKEIYKIYSIVVTASPYVGYLFKMAHSFVFEEKPNLEMIDFKKSCAFHKGPSKNSEVINFECQSSWGSYVAIALEGKKQQLEMCQLRVNGQKVDWKWSEWNDQWSECSNSCGGGLKSRSRSCNPIPQYRGKKCEGDTNQSMSCNNEKCPVDLKKMSTLNKIIFPLIASMGAVLVIAAVIAAGIYRRKKSRPVTSLDENSYVYQESGMD